MVFGKMSENIYSEFPEPKKVVSSKFLFVFRMPVQNIYFELIKIVTFENRSLFQLQNMGGC